MENFIRKYYPHAVEGKELTKTCVDKMVEEYHFDLEKTLMAASVCSDEIIRSATNFREYMGIRYPFHLGGLAGVPFTGLTGFKAFASHIPDDGSAIIIFGPHIGVSRLGEVGLMQRHGQREKTSCCGALGAALRAVENNTAPSADRDLDYQLWRIEREIGENHRDVTQHEQPLVAVTDAVYEWIYTTLKKMVTSSEGETRHFRLALIGGVIINTDFDLPDWFDLRCFEIIEGGSSKELII